MASERQKGYRKLSCGILKSRTFDTGANHRENRGVKIYVKNHHDNGGALPPEVDEEQFEHLKDMYYKQCQPINMNLIRKLTEKRTASNYNYYNSAQCSRVLAPGASSTSSTSNTSTVAQPSHRDIAVKSRDHKSSGSGGGRNHDAKDLSCAKCHRRHY